VPTFSPAAVTGRLSESSSRRLTISGQDPDLAQRRFTDRLTRSCSKNLILRGHLPVNSSTNGEDVGFSMRRRDEYFIASPDMASWLKRSFGASGSAEAERRYRALTADRQHAQWIFCLNDLYVLAA